MWRPRLYSPHHGDNSDYEFCNLATLMTVPRMSPFYSIYCAVCVINSYCRVPRWQLYDLNQIGLVFVMVLPGMRYVYINWFYGNESVVRFWGGDHSVAHSIQNTEQKTYESKQTLPHWANACKIDITWKMHKIYPSIMNVLYSALS